MALGESGTLQRTRELHFAAARRWGPLEAHRRAGRRHADARVGRRRVQLARQKRRRQLVALFHFHLTQ